VGGEVWGVRRVWDEEFGYGARVCGDRGDEVRVVGTSETMATRVPQVWGLGSWVSGLEFRVWDLGFGVWGFEFRVLGFWRRVLGVGFPFLGVGCRVHLLLLFFTKLQPLKQ